MSAIQQTIVLLEQELEGLDQRRGEITRAIDTLRPLAGDGVTSVSRSGRRKTQRSGSAKKATRAAAVSTNEDHHALIVAALRTAGGSMTPGELAKALKMQRVTVTKWVKPLLLTKAIIATGATFSRRLSLPGHGPKEAP